MSETANSSSSPADIDEIVAVILRDNHGRVLVIRATETPEFVLPFGSINDTINPAHAAQLIAHEAIRAAVDVSKLRRLATYVSAAANDAPHTPSTLTSMSVKKKSPLPILTRKLPS